MLRAQPEVGYSQTRPLPLPDESRSTDYVEMSERRSTLQPLRPGRIELVPVTGPGRAAALPNQINGTRGISRW